MTSKLTKPPKFFRTITNQKLKLPLFFPDATRAVIKSLDTLDIVSSQTPGILVNTYHLINQPGKSTIKLFKGIRNYMSWPNACISDSGGFQIMSIAKTSGLKNPVTDKGVNFKQSKNKTSLFTPQDSINMQSVLKTDLFVVLDDFTPPNSSKRVARDTVDRTIKWAKTCKDEYERIFKNTPTDKRPYLIGVVQGGEYLDLRKECTQKLVEIGFDGLGYGGWPIDKDGHFNYEVAKVIKDNAPLKYLLYGLGIGKPDEIRNLVNSGWHIFDCVLPTRDARHRRLYVYDANSIDDIDITQDKFYSYYVPDKEKYYKDILPVSTACDCHLCKHYSRSYLHHLFKIGDSTAGRLASIHNLRFYSILMEKLQHAVN